MCMLSGSACPTPYNPKDCSLPGSSVHGFSRQEYWSGFPFPTLRDLSEQVIKPKSPAPQMCNSCTAGVFFTTAPSGKLIKYTYVLNMTEKKAFSEYFSKENT